MYYSSQPGYILSLHAQERLEQRHMTPAHIAGALAGRCVETTTDQLLLYDRTSHAALVVDPATRVVVTAYWVTRHEIKRLYSR